MPFNNSMVPNVFLNFKRILFGQAALALADEDRRLRAPGVIQALVFELGHHGRDLARQLGVSQPTFSKWVSGRYPIPQHHSERLIALLRVGLDAAEEVIRQAPQSTVQALPNYKRRVARARVILEEIDVGT